MYAKKNYDKYLSALKNSGLVSVEEKAQGATADVTVGAEGGAGAMVLLGEITITLYTKSIYINHRSAIENCFEVIDNLHSFLRVQVQKITNDCSDFFAASKQRVKHKSTKRLINNETAINNWPFNPQKSCEFAVTTFSNTFCTQYT